MSLQQPIQRDKIDSRAVYGLKQRRLTATSFSAGLKSPTTPEAGLGLLLEHADVATTSNVTLSGLQNLDGETGAAGDVVLVRAQTDETENGLYFMASGTWSRVVDAVALRRLVRVRAGTTQGETVSLLGGADDPDIGTDDVVYASLLKGSGTDDKLARWGSGGLVDSLIGDSGTHITIGTGAGPTGLLTVRRDLSAGHAIYSSNESTSGSGTAIYGLGRNSAGAAIEGWSLGTNGKGVKGQGYYGIFGTTGTGYAGVYGEATGNAIAMRAERNVASATAAVVQILQKDTGNSGVGLQIVQSGSSTGLLVTGGSGRAAHIERNSNTATVPVAYIHADHAGDTNAVLRVNGDGTGNILELQDAGTTILSVADGGELNTSGCGMRLGNATISANTTLAKDDHVVFCDTSAAGGNITVTLPTSTAGKEFIVINIDGTTSLNQVVIAPSGGAKINGVAGNITYGSAYWQLRIIGDGTDWFVFS